MNQTSFMGVKTISGFAMAVRKMEDYEMGARVVKMTLGGIPIQLPMCVLLMDVTMTCVKCALSGLFGRTASGHQSKCLLTTLLHRI